MAVRSIGLEYGESAASATAVELAKSVVVAGHICLDVIPDLSTSPPGSFNKVFVPGQLINAGPVSFSTGGPVSNTGLALHKLGIPTRLMGKVGDDLFGSAVRQIVSGYGPQLADGMVVSPSVDTSYSVIVNYPGIDRIILHCPGANDTFGADDVRYDFLENATLFHFGYPPLMKRMYENDGAELAEVFRRAKATGVTTTLDMAAPDPTSAAGRSDWRRILNRVLPYVDVFMPSGEEILYMLRRNTFDALRARSDDGNILPLLTPELVSDVGRELLGMGAKVVGIKLGSRGLYLRTADRTALDEMGRARPIDTSRWAARELWAPCFWVQVVGTTGSGDATIAGLFSALLRDFSPEDALTAAVAVGACNVEAADALSGIRSWEETLARIQSGWKRHSLVLDSPGWRFDETAQLWVGPYA